MIDLRIPGASSLHLHSLVTDYNGTLALDGFLIDGVRPLLHSLAESLEIHVVTADTFARVEEEMGDGPWTIGILSPEAQAEAKRDYVARLGAAGVAAMGNGANDRAMLRAAGLSIALILSAFPRLSGDSIPTRH